MSTSILNDLPLVGSLKITLYRIEKKKHVFNNLFRENKITHQKESDYNQRST